LKPDALAIDFKMTKSVPNINLSPNKRTMKREVSNVELQKLAAKLVEKMK
jgi:hypothetical protein